MREIKLTKGYVALVDDSDFLYLTLFKWHATVIDRGGQVKVYARRTTNENGKPVHIFMHRLLCSSVPGQEVDHKDGSGLNNQRLNLRSATRTQNHANRYKRVGKSSKHKGVCYDPQRRRWCAYICLAGRRVNLGRYADESLASEAYALAAKNAFGEFAQC